MNIRWMIRRDMAEVMAIESASFDYPLTESEFIDFLKQRNSIGMVAEHENGRILGYIVYELHKTHLHVINLAVHPKHRNQGIGRALLAKLESKLSPERRNRIRLKVRETNLEAQQFLRTIEYKAKSVVRNCFFDSGEDAYIFVKRVTVAETI